MDIEQINEQTARVERATARIERVNDGIGRVTNTLAYRLIEGFLEAAFWVALVAVIFVTDLTRHPTLLALIAATFIASGMLYAVQTFYLKRLVTELEQQLREAQDEASQA